MTLKRNGERLRENISIYDTRLCVGEFAKKRYARENGISQLVVDKPRGFREERGSERYSKLVSVNSKSIYQSPRSCVCSRSAKFEIRDVSLWLIIRDSNCVVLDMFSLRLSFFFCFYNLWQLCVQTGKVEAFLRDKSPEPRRLTSTYKIYESLKICQRLYKLTFT